MKLRNFLKGFSALSLIFLAIGVFVLVQVISGGDIFLLKPAHDFDYIMENGLCAGDHVKGDIPYTLGGFASKETYTHTENYRTPGETNGFFYLIPVGENGMAAVYIRKDDFDAMDALADETYAYMASGSEPTTRVSFEGTAVEMDRHLKGLETHFTDALTKLGFDDDDIRAMLQATGGKFLVLQGPSNVPAMYVMMAAAVVFLLLGVILFVLKYKREKARAEALEEEWTKV